MYIVGQCFSRCVIDLLCRSLLGDYCIHIWCFIVSFTGISSASTESPAASSSADDTGVTSLTGRTDVDLVDEGISSPRSDSTTAAVCDEKLKPVNKLNTSSLMDNTKTDQMGPEGQSMTHSDDKQTADSVQSVTAAPSGSDEAADVSDSSSQQQTVIVEGTLGTTDDGLDDLLQGITVDEMSELITMALDDDQSLPQANGSSSEQTKSNTEKVADLITNSLPSFQSHFKSN